MSTTIETLSRVLEFVRSDQLPLTEVRVTPDLGFVYGAWGQPFDNETLFHYLAPHVKLPPQELADKIAAAGFTVRHHDIWGRGRSIAADTSIETAIGIRTLSRALELQHVHPTELNRLYVSMSAPASPHIAHMIAESIGIDSSRVSRYGFACNGGVLALGDALDRPEDGYFAILVVEGASKGVALGQNGKFDVDAAIDFGNGAVAMVFRRERFEKKVNAAITLPDVEGTFRAPNTHELDISRYVSKAGVQVEIGNDRYLLMAEPPIDDQRIIMTRKVISFFVRLATATTILAVEQYIKRPDAVVSLQIVSHQPHQGIHDLGNCHIAEEALNRGWPQLHNPWVMDEVGMGNCVSAVALINLAHQLATGQLPLGEDFLLLGYGAGGSAKAMVLNIAK